MWIFGHLILLGRLHPLESLSRANNQWKTSATIPNYRHSQRRRSIDLFSHYPGVCIPGDGLSPVSPRTAPPPMAIATTVQCTGRSREEPDSGPLTPSPGKPASAPLPGHGFPRDIAMTALAPGRGRGRSAQRGRGGGYEEGYYEFRRLRGGGDPLPGPHPRGDTHHGSLPGVSQGIPGSGPFPLRG